MTLIYKPSYLVSVKYNFLTLFKPGMQDIDTYTSVDDSRCITFLRDIVKTPSNLGDSSVRDSTGPIIVCALVGGANWKGNA